MLTEKEVKKLVKGRKVWYGIRQARKALKNLKAEKIIIVNRPDLKEEFKDAEIFEGDEKRLGVICGKPFNVSVITILKEE